jgi:hypothetical protein
VLRWRAIVLQENQQDRDDDGRRDRNEKRLLAQNASARTRAFGTMRLIEALRSALIDCSPLEGELVEVIPLKRDPVG